MGTSDDLPKSGQSGSSLIEVMISMAVLSIVALGVATASRQAFSDMRKARFAAGRRLALGNIYNWANNSRALLNVGGALGACLDSGNNCNDGTTGEFALNSVEPVPRPVSGTTAAPVRYRADGSLCDAAEALSENCPLEAVTSFTARCRPAPYPNPCPGADYLEINYSLRYTFAGNIDGVGIVKSVNGRILRNAEDITGSVKFYEPGATTWVVPSGVYNITVQEIVGGGEGGQAGYSNPGGSSGGRGGNGAEIKKNLPIAVTPGSVCTFIVGAGGGAAPSQPVPSPAVLDGQPGGKSEIWCTTPPPSPPAPPPPFPDADALGGSAAAPDGSRMGGAPGTLDPMGVPLTFPAAGTCSAAEGGVGGPTNGPLGGGGACGDLDLNTPVTTSTAPNAGAGGPGEGGGGNAARQGASGGIWITW